MKIQATGAKISIPIYDKAGKYVKTIYASRDSKPVEVEDKLAKKLIAKGYVKEAAKKVKPATIKAQKPDESKNREAVNENEGILPPGAQPVSRKG